MKQKILLNQTLVKFYTTIILCLVFVLPLKCLALDVPPRPQLPPVWLAFSRFVMVFLWNALILVIGYLILKRKDLIKSWKGFSKYIFLVSIVTFLIDEVDIYGWQAVIYYSWRPYSWVAIILFIPLFLFVYNYCLSKKFFNLTRKQALFIGLIMGLFASPVVVVYLIFGLWDLLFHKTEPSNLPPAPI